MCFIAGVDWQWPIKIAPPRARSAAEFAPGPPELAFIEQDKPVFIDLCKIFASFLLPQRDKSQAVAEIDSREGAFGGTRARRRRLSSSNEEKKLMLNWKMCVSAAQSAFFSTKALRLFDVCLCLCARRERSQS